MPTGVDESRVSIPLSVRLRFGNAAVQVLADEIGVDLLHIKGATVDPSLRPVERTGTDVDVIVRPAQVAHCANATGPSTARSSTVRRSAMRRRTSIDRGAISTSIGSSRVSGSHPTSRSTDCGALVAPRRSRASDAPYRAFRPRRCSSC